MTDTKASGASLERGERGKHAENAEVVWGIGEREGRGKHAENTENFSELCVDSAFSAFSIILVFFSISTFFPDNHLLAPLRITRLTPYSASFGL